MMSMILEVSCSNHQSKNGPENTHLWIESPKELDREVVKRRLEQRNWVVQFNGGHMDTYCSKECAR